MTKPKPSRTRWKVALGVTVMFAVMGWLFAWPAYERHRAIQEIKRVGEDVGRESVGPQWLSQWSIGRDEASVIPWMAEPARRCS